MSVEANTYEELHIRNVNEKTAAICHKVGEYLNSTWGIISLALMVDGKQYESAEDSISEDSELWSACKALAGAKEIQLALRSCNGGGVNWRLEESFMKHFADDAEVKANVTYRCTEYYDTGPGVAMYRYDENGLQCMKYTDLAESVADIKEWYCYTPTLRIADDEQMGNAELHDQLIAIVKNLCELFGLDEEDMEDLLDDDWEDYGEIVFSGSIRFATENIPEIMKLANQLAALETAEYELEIYAVPDGEGDYDFASVAIEADGNTVKDTYCRF